MKAIQNTQNTLWAGCRICECSTWCYTK